MTTLDSKSLRKHLRNIRQSLTQSEQKQHAQNALVHFKDLLKSNPTFTQPQKIAFFLAQDGELETHQCIDYLWNKTDHLVFLPVLETRKEWHMAFAQFTSRSKMTPNQFGIEEPLTDFSNHLSGDEMDWVFMPLVGFDEMGNRLGMGGGFYDRTFAFKLHQKNQTTQLIGWAHECQKIEQLNVEKWDVPLDGVITEQGFKAYK